MNISRIDGNQIITAKDLKRGYECLYEAEKTMESAFAWIQQLFDAIMSILPKNAAGVLTAKGATKAIKDYFAKK